MKANQENTPFSEKVIRQLIIFKQPVNWLKNVMNSVDPSASDTWIMKKHLTL